ncbi:MAG TPA: hypothetical protein VLF63_02930, partial [Patescibacteria group bacterium]|nr:hypothetical protein [Patescibacteria group bacterium]
MKKLKIKFKRWLVPLFVIVVVASIGTYLLTRSHASSLPLGMAFQANTNYLWTAGSTNNNTGLGMMPGTSPSITLLSNGGYEVAFQANDGNLWITGSAGTQNMGLGMMAGTIPSITATANGGYEIAFQAN